MANVTLPKEWTSLMAIEMSHPNDNAERINIGLEVTYLDMISLRGGHKIRYKNQFGYDEERWSGGIGFKVPLGSTMQVSLDYAYVGMGLLGEAAGSFMASPHRFALGVNF
jgi:hypothetical protein